MHFLFGRPSSVNTDEEVASKLNSVVEERIGMPMTKWGKAMRSDRAARGELKT